MSILHMLDLWHSPYVLVLGIYGWGVVVKGDRSIITMAKHTLPSKVCDQGHCPSNPDPHCHVALATQLQMSISVGLHSNQPSYLATNMASANH